MLVAGPLQQQRHLQVAELRPVEQPQRKQRKKKRNKRKRKSLMKIWASVYSTKNDFSNFLLLLLLNDTIKSFLSLAKNLLPIHIIHGRRAVFPGGGFFPKIRLPIRPSMIHIPKIFRLHASHFTFSMFSRFSTPISRCFISKPPHPYNAHYSS